MVRYLLTFLLLCCLTAGTAQTGEELVELDTENLALSAWQDLYQQLEEFKAPLKQDFRLRLSEGNDYLLSTSWYRRPEQMLLLNLRQDLVQGGTQANFHLQTSSPSTSLMLGSLRCRFGRGLLLGNGSRSLPEKVFSFSLPNSPTLFTPWGGAVQHRYNALHTMLLASSQSRDAGLKDGAISSLPKYRTDSIGSVHENIFAAALGYDTPTLKVGGMAYYQDYDRPFSSADLVSELWAFSGMASLRFERQRLDAEVAVVDGHWQHLISWSYNHKSLRHTISHAINPPQNQLPYALAPGLLNGGSGNSEYSYDAVLPLLKHTTLHLRSSLNHGRSSGSDDLFRLLGALEYKTTATSGRISFQSFSRKIISLRDSTYQSTLPQNWRFRLTARHYVLPALYQKLDFSYRFEDKVNYDQNIFRFDISLGYGWRDLDLKAGFQTTQSPRSFLIEDLDEPEYYSLSSGDETLLYAAGSMKLKRWRITVSHRQSLLDLSRYQANLRLSLALL